MNFSQSSGGTEPHRLQPNITSPIGSLTTNALQQCLLEYGWVRNRQDAFQYGVRDYSLSEARLGVADHRDEGGSSSIAETE